MSERINRETRLPYARFDGSIVNGDNPRRGHKPDWKDEYLELLQRSDYDAAHELRLRNDERYAERCEQEAANIFPVEHKPLLSIRESAITAMVEQEDAIEDNKAKAEELAEEVA